MPPKGEGGRQKGAEGELRQQPKSVVVEAVVETQPLGAEEHLGEAKGELDPLRPHLLLKGADIWQVP